jgi:hypothetical protein
MAKSRLRSDRQLVTLCMALSTMALSTPLTACQQSWTALLSPKPPTLALVSLEAQQTTPGSYALSGRTDLPDKTQLRVAALRRLQPHSSQPTDAQPTDAQPTDAQPTYAQPTYAQPTYALLAYGNAEVVGGQWQAQLNLWQVAPDGRSRENWQLTQEQMKLKIKPEPEVMFLATIAPGNKFEQLDRLEQELSKQGKRLDSSLISSTTDGTRYLRVNQTLRVDLPTASQTTAPKITAEQRNGGWGDRWILVEEVPNPEALEFPSQRRTNAPPSPQEFLQ